MPHATAALGFAAYSALMTLGRLSGDRLVARFGGVSLVRLGGCLGFVGLMMVVVMPQVGTVLLGFALVGCGLAVVVPLAFSAAGKLGGLPPGAGIAGVASIGYAGFLAGPPVIGLIAEATSLQWSFVLVAVLVGSLMWSARNLTP